MIESMTGFASKSFVLYIDDTTKSSVSSSLKSLNARFFEVNCKLPHALSHLETSFIRLFKKRLQRGYVYFTVHMSNPNLFKGAVEPALSVLRNYITALDIIRGEFDIKEPVNLENILALPNVFTVEEQRMDEESTQKVLEVADELIATVLEERKKEGEALEEDLKKRLGVLAKEIDIIQQRSEHHVEEQRRKVQEVLQDIGGDESELADTRKSAIYAILDKIDINEEIVRFKSHLGNLMQNLESEDVEKGKRLDFILQELAREINTIAAKCSDATIGTHAINAKVEIEKAREQVQNIV